MTAPTTPAPGYAGHSWRAELCDDGTWMVCTVGDVIASGLTEANARLIAAEPEMYGALVAIVEDTAKYGGRVPDFTLRIIRAALAKAEGRADA